MSKHNRDRKKLHKLGLTGRQLAKKYGQPWWMAKYHRSVKGASK